MLGKHGGVTHSSGLPGTRAFPGVQDIQYQDLGSPRQTGTTSHPHSINLRPTCSKCRFQSHKFCRQSSFKPYWCPLKSEDMAQEGCLRNAGPCRPLPGSVEGTQCQLTHSWAPRQLRPSFRLVHPFSGEDDGDIDDADGSPGHQMSVLSPQLTDNRTEAQR